MSHYPMGVTGREPQIAGPLGELTRTIACDAATEGLGLPLVWLQTLQLAMQEATNDGATPMTSSMPKDWRLKAVKRDLDALLAQGTTDDIDCPFEGPIEFTVWNREEAGADCPICGREITVDLTD